MKMYTRWLIVGIIGGFISFRVLAGVEKEGAEEMVEWLLRVVARESVEELGEDALSHLMRQAARQSYDAMLEALSDHLTPHLSDDLLEELWRTSRGAVADLSLPAAVKDAPDMIPPDNHIFWQYLQRRYMETADVPVSLDRSARFPQPIQQRLFFPSISSGFDGLDDIAYYEAFTKAVSDHDHLIRACTDSAHLTHTMVGVLNDATGMSSLDYSQPVSKPWMLIAMPLNADEFHNVYPGQALTVNHARTLEILRGSLQPTQGISATARSWAAAQQEILAAPGNLFVLTGHSRDAGQTLVMPDGEAVAVQTIHDFFLTIEKVGMVLTCYGDDFLIDDTLAPRQALAMWQHAYEQSQSLTIRQYLNRMAAHYQTLRQRERLKMAGFIMLPTVGGAGYLYQVSTRE